jgi:hypothetical protein
VNTFEQNNGIKLEKKRAETPMTLLLVVHTPYQIQVFEFAKHRAR